MQRLRIVRWLQGIVQKNLKFQCILFFHSFHHTLSHKVFEAIIHHHL